MSEDAIFFRQAAEAIVATSLNASNVDPTIRELLSRIKYVNPTLSQVQSSEITSQVDSVQQSRNIDSDPREQNSSLLPSDSRSLLDYFPTPLNVNLSGVGTAASFDSNISDRDIKQKKKYNNENSDQEADDADGITNDNLSRRSSSEKLTDHKKFPCAKCKLVFRRSSDLRRHERTHLPVLPNICSQCGKGFARKDALKRHFDTLTCRRNRSKLLSIGGDINDILERARQTGTGV